MIADERDHPRLVVFGDDWGRHPSSCQHLVSGLLSRYSVDWVNTIGMRSPKLCLADLGRGVGKVRQWLGGRGGYAQDRGGSRAPESLPLAVLEQPSLRVHSPMMWPSFGGSVRRRLNAKLLKRSLATVLEGGGPDGLVPAEAIITTVPVIGDLVRHTRHLNWIYYCCDDYAAWPGNDGEVIRRLEGELLAHARTVVVTSEALAAHVGARGRRGALLTHGVDVAFWTGASPRPQRVDGSGRPKALFWGRVDARLDGASCAALADVADLVLVGAVESVDRSVSSDPRIQCVGQVPLAELPSYAADADVLVMPYVDSAATRAMQPLKLKEYLATGLPVLAAPLPAVASWSDALDVCATPEEFARMACTRAQSPLPVGQRTARRRLAEEGWAAKSLEFERLFRS